MDTFFPQSALAVISPCGKYRYLLTRVWDESKPSAYFVMLNPSTADANVNDATIRRLMKFAQLWDKGGIVVANLFAYRATKPVNMFSAGDPSGPDNQLHWSGLCLHARAFRQPVICAWGAFGGYRGQDAAFVQMARAYSVELRCLRLTSRGMPEHPLFVPYKTELISYGVVL